MLDLPELDPPLRMIAWIVIAASYEK